MNPVVGLNVEKGESQVQMFLDKKTPYKSSVKIAHTVEEIDCFKDYFPVVHVFLASITCVTCIEN
jgi:transposase